MTGPDRSAELPRREKGERLPTEAREINFHSRESGKDFDFLIGGIDKAGGQYVPVKLFWEKDQPPQYGLREVTAIVYDPTDGSHYAWIGPPENAPGVQRGDRKFLDKAKPMRDAQLEHVRWNTVEAIVKAENTLLSEENKRMQAREEQAMNVAVELRKIRVMGGRPGDRLRSLKQLGKLASGNPCAELLIEVLEQEWVDEAKRRMRSGMEQ